MLFRCLWAVGSPVTAIAFVSLASIGAQSQAPSNAPSAKTASNPTRTAKPPRGQNGRPDLEGVWNFSTITPLQRPQELAEKEFLTDEDAAALEQRAAESRVERAPTPADLGGHNQFWNDRGTKVAATMRTSLIVDPPDGKLPALTPEGQKRAAAVAEAERRSAGPEDFLVYVRCILGFNAGPPIIPGPYNNFIEIIQTADHVVIHNEMVHDARIVPLDGRPHGKIRQWMGDSRGRWEGVVRQNSAGVYRRGNPAQALIRRLRTLRSRIEVSSRWTPYRLTKGAACDPCSRRTDVQPRRALRSGAYAACRS
jgi:hypothetical protein